MAEIEAVEPIEIDLLRRDINLLRRDTERLKVGIQEVKNQNELILIELTKLRKASPASYLLTLKSYCGLPIPKLTLYCDVRGWFQRYAIVMGTDDQMLLTYCLGYYLDDEVAVAFSKSGIKHCDSIYLVQDKLSSEISKARRQKAGWN